MDGGAVAEEPVQKFLGAGNFEENIEDGVGRWGVGRSEPLGALAFVNGALGDVGGVVAEEAQVNLRNGFVAPNVKGTVESGGVGERRPCGDLAINCMSAEKTMNRKDADVVA